MAGNGITDIGRVFRAATYSFQGLRAAWASEAAFRQELVLFVFLFPLGLWLGHGGVERVLLTGSLLLVLIIELLNSAIEAVVDRFGDEQHVLAGRAKDIASAAVFVALINVPLTWLLILAG